MVLLLLVGAHRLYVGCSSLLLIVVVVVIVIVVIDIALSGHLQEPCFQTTSG